jgi:hypothetical protein
MHPKHPQCPVWIDLRDQISGPRAPRIEAQALFLVESVRDVIEVLAEIRENLRALALAQVYPEKAPQMTVRSEAASRAGSRDHSL